MDPTKPSHVNSGRGNDSLMEESWVLRRDSVEGERQRDTETREPDVVDGTLAAAEINNQQRGSADKNRSNTFGYQRQTKLKVVTDFSTVSKGVSVGAKPRVVLKQVLFSQSEKNPPSEEQGQLDSLKQDLGTYAVPANLNWMWKEESRGTMLEKNWTEIVASHSTMSKMQRYQQEALWEFVHTELAYINKLIIMKDLVIAALVNLHRNGFLQEVTPERLFSNLPSILKAHQLFWQEVIYPMLHEVRRTGMPFDPMMLEAGCLQFHQRFSSYLHYCWEEENSLGFTRRQLESNPHFFTFVQVLLQGFEISVLPVFCYRSNAVEWVETHPQCKRMRLGDMQAKPHQRITKYPLLLKAVLKTTQDPHVQHTLRGMLSSVKSFLESINDYLKLKDEELALSISAQRVEGYEVEGINEEIDKHVRDICQFDLTCPIRGVGPGVVRKLLLEENLKIRWRKDSKLEVVALLFSDVVLMTKVQKKGERLKVVQPPLALDRTYCIALKDGCSFVLVEVGELQSAMNVYIFVASTSESCSMWVSTIQQAKETLKSWRETESNRKLENWKIRQLEAKSVTVAKTDDMATGEQLLTQSGGETFVDELQEECLTPRSINGMPPSKEAEEQPPDEVASYKNVVSLFHSQPNNGDCKVSDKCFADQQQAVKGYEWIEMGVRRQEIGIHRVEEEKIVKRVMTKERKLAWNHRAKSAPLLDHFNHFIAADPLRHSTTGPYTLLQGEYPDVDYPMNEDSSTQPIYQPTLSSEFSRIPEKGGASTKRDSDSQSVTQGAWTNSSTSTSPEAWSLKNLKSPGLRRRRLSSTHSAQTSPQLFQDSGPTWSASLSNSDSHYNLNTKRNFVSLENSSDSRRVLKLGSLKPNQEMSWNMHAEIPLDPQTLSEPELSDLNFNGKWPKTKTQRSVSIPNIKGGHELRLHSRSLYTLPQEKETQIHVSQYHPSGHPSTLEGLLERAKERVRERDGLKRDRTVKSATLRSKYPPPSPSFSTTPSPSTSDGDRDTEWEEEVELMRHRALTVSKGWKEQLVDEDEDEQRDSAVCTDGVNVDWPGWCFDDDEVMNHVNPREEGLLEGISRSLSLWNRHSLSAQEDGECSQV